MKNALGIVAVAVMTAAASLHGFAAPAGQSGKPLRMAVFVGKGACGAGVFHWVRLLASIEDAECVPVDGELVRGGVLDKADVLVVPGGWSVVEAKTLGKEGGEKLRAFVKNGGSYVGTCAGCSLLMEPSKGHPGMLHMIPFKFGRSSSHIDMPVMFNRRAEELCGIKRGETKVRYSMGPVPLPSVPVPESDVEVVGYYNGNIKPPKNSTRPSMAGQACAIAGTYGKGRLFVFAVHPEYDVNDHWLLQRAFHFVTGRDVTWQVPPRREGQTSVGILCEDSFGVKTANFLARLVKDGEFHFVPFAEETAAESFAVVDAVMAPDGEGLGSPKVGLYGKNAEKTRNFIAGGKLVLAWGTAAKAAEQYEPGVTRVADSASALKTLREYVKNSRCRKGTGTREK